MCNRCRTKYCAQVSYHFPQGEFSCFIAYSHLLRFQEIMRFRSLLNHFEIMAFTLCFCKLLWFQVTLSLSLCGILSTHTSSSIWYAVFVHAVLCLYLRFLSFFSHLLWISNVNFFILLSFLTTLVVQHCVLSLIYCDFKQITEKWATFLHFFLYGNICNL